MPIYEYICEQDGERIELLRSMADADAPVVDPKGKGRTFKRAQSAFAVGKAEGGFDPAAFGGGGCACGNPDGPCNS